MNSTICQQDKQKSHAYATDFKRSKSVYIIRSGNEYWHIVDNGISTLRLQIEFLGHNIVSIVDCTVHTLINGVTGTATETVLCVIISQNNGITVERTATRVTQCTLHKMQVYGLGDMYIVRGLQMSEKYNCTNAIWRC